MNEIIERRVFGAIEFIDNLTEARVLEPLRIAAPGMSLRRNRSGQYVIRELDGHDDYTRRFDAAPPAPPRSDVSLSVEDPRQRYLPQSFTLSLPRLLRMPASPVADADNAFRPAQLRLWPAAALPVRAAWAVMRLSVIVDASNPPLGLANVIVEARPKPAGLALQRAMTDRNGEALVVIQGAAPVLPGGGAAGLTREFKAAITLVLDRQVVRTSADATMVLQRRDAHHSVVLILALGDHSFTAGVSRRHVESVTWP